MDQLLSSQQMEDPSSERGARRLPDRSGRRPDNNLIASGDQLAVQADASLGEARLIRLPAVQERVGMGRTAVYELIKAGKFPRPVKVGPSRSARRVRGSTSRSHAGSSNSLRAAVRPPDGRR